MEISVTMIRVTPQKANGRYFRVGTGRSARSAHRDPLLHEKELQRRQAGTAAKYSATSRQLFTRTKPVALRLWGAE